MGKRTTKMFQVVLVMALMSVIGIAQTPSGIGGTAYRARKGTPKPATCAVGDLWMDTTASPAVLYNCTTTNTWVIAGTTVLTGHGVAAPLRCVDASGSTTAYTCTTSPSFTPGDDDIIVLDVGLANTGAATLVVNGQAGTPAINKYQGVALVANDLIAGSDIMMVFNGTNWQIVGTVANTTGTGSQVFSTSPTFAGVIAGPNPFTFNEAQNSVGGFQFQVGVTNLFTIAEDASSTAGWTANFITGTHDSIGVVGTMLGITGTWNRSSITGTGILLNVTDTSSAATALLEDLQVASTSKWNVDKTGSSTQQGNATVNSNQLVTRTVCANVTPVTVSANVSTDQLLMACTIPATSLNVLLRTLEIDAYSIYTTAASSTSQLTYKIKICTVSGCGSGTVVTAISIQSVAIATLSITNNAASLHAHIITQTIGATASFEAHGRMDVDLGALTTAADSIFNDTNTATVGTIDATGQLFIQITGAFSGASASNSWSQRSMLVKISN